MYTADFTPVRADRTSSDGAGALKPRAVPPHNGFGSDDDSLGNCLSLMPKPPRRDFARFMQLDSCALESHVLRFLAKLHLSSAPAADDGDDDGDGNGDDGGGTRLDLSSGPAAAAAAVADDDDDDGGGTRLDLSSGPADDDDDGGTRLDLSSAPAAAAAAAAADDDDDDDGGGTRLDLSSGPAADPSGTAAERRFIICFHLADGTVCVFEQSSRNAGTKLPSVAKCLEWYLRTSDLK